MKYRYEPRLLEIETEDLILPSEEIMPMFSGSDIRRIADLMEKVSQMGPVIIREKQDTPGKFEIVAGFSTAARYYEAGERRVPARVHYSMSDPHAALVMTRSMLSCMSGLRPSDYIKIYATRSDSLQKMNMNNSNLYRRGNLPPVHSREEIDGYVGMRNLIPGLMRMFDLGRFDTGTGVMLAGLDGREQSEIYVTMKEENCEVMMQQARILCTMKEQGLLDRDRIARVLGKPHNGLHGSLRLDRDVVDRFFPEGTSDEKKKECIYSLIENTVRERVSGPGYER